VFLSILHVFYDILMFLCITFDALQMHLIVTDGSVTLTNQPILSAYFLGKIRTNFYCWIYHR